MSPIINDAFRIAPGVVVSFGAAPDLHLSFRLDPKFEIYDSTPLPVDMPPHIDPDFLKDIGDFVEDPEAWLCAPNILFEGRAPIELVGTPEEARIRERIEAARFGLFT